MKIVRERTRLIFFDYNDNDKRMIEELVSTMDKVFTFEDLDKHIICLPPGMEESIRRTFKIPIEDKSKMHWPADKVSFTPEKYFGPRNDMQKDAIEFGLSQIGKNEKLGLILGPGSGKCEPYSTHIPTPTKKGWTAMEDIEKGDYVFGSDGKPVKVLETYPQGRVPIFRVHFDDGRHNLCGLNHLWTVTEKDNDRDSSQKLTLTTEELIKRLKYMNGNEYFVQIPSLPVEYADRGTLSDPFMLGISVDIGTKMSYVYTLETSKRSIAKLVASILDAKPRKAKSDGYTFIRKDNGKRVEFRNVILYDDRDYVDDGILPDAYIYNSTEIRRNVLKGLLCASGKVLKNGKIFYPSTNRQLLRQMQAIIFSLGMHAILGANRGMDGIIITGRRKDVLGILADGKTKDRYMKRAWLTNGWNYSKITKIEYDHYELAKCITVDAEDQLYLSDQFVVTHNTFIACYLAVKTGLKTLIIAPTTNVRGQWAATLKDMFNIPEDKITVVQNPSDLIHTHADYIITLQASLSNINKRYDLEKILKDKHLGIKIIDETHMYFHNIIRVDGCSNIKHNWYVTATFGRSSEDEDRIYHEMFGDIGLFRVKDKKSTLFNRKPGDIYGQKPHMNVDMFWLKSGLTSDQIKKVNTSKRYNPKDEKWIRYGISIPKYTELIIPSDGSMTLFLKKALDIIKQTERKVTYGRTLILTPTIASVEVLANHVRKLFPDKDVGTIHSRNSAEENDRVMKESHFIISTIKSSGTGFDVKDLAKLVCLEQFKSQILAEQVSGRLRRRPDGKETYMADIVDANVRQLRAWGASRAQILKRKSKKFTVIDV